MRAQLAVPAGASPVARTAVVAQVAPMQARPRGVSFAAEEVSRIPAPTQLTPLSLPLQTRARTETSGSIQEEARVRTWTMESATAIQEVPYSQRRKSSFAAATPDSRWCPGYSSAIAFPGVTDAPALVVPTAPVVASATSPAPVMLHAPPGQVATSPGTSSARSSLAGQPQPQPNGGAYMAQTGPAGQFYMQMPPGYVQMPMFQLPGGGYMQMPPGYQGFPVPQAPMPAVQGRQQRRSSGGAAFPPADDSEPITTIMLRNIPLKYTRQTLLSDMDARGFRNQYDFFYLPMDFERKCSVGYAFINFTSPDIVVRFKSIYQGLQLATDSAKVCEVGNAKVQGKQKNIQYYRNSSVMGMDEEYQPVIFENGVRVPFPRPTQTPKPFRPRGSGAGGKP